MTRSMRAALIAFAVALALLPVLSLDPLLLHLDEQGEMEWRRGLTDPGFLTLLAIAAIAALFVLPLCSLMESARRSRRATRELAETAQRRTAHGILDSRTSSRSPSRISISASTSTSSRVRTPP